MANFTTESECHRSRISGKVAFPFNVKPNGDWLAIRYNYTKYDITLWTFRWAMPPRYDPLSGRGVALALTKGVAIARLITNGMDLSCAFAAHADAERASFDDFRAQQRKKYRRPAPRFRSAFWERRCG
jgi:hypothetical protein